MARKRNSSFTEFFVKTSPKVSRGARAEALLFRPCLQQVSIHGEVVAVTPVREFVRQDGTKGRVVNVTLRDVTGACRVVLWDDDVALVTDGRLKIGGFLRCLDCFVRRTNFGLEVGRGKFGALLPE